ncbi:reverse transcriptase domain-containing protein, partial [Streptomyces caniscabiei]|uniref:reverse transcriptase domain-containing protein n=1 Tax=Streptomyces caniscabiei TaxID=2746961 RepID=UPI0038F6C765
EIVNGKGKRRTITSYEMVDKYISTLLSQKLNRFYQPLFLENSYAYQENKGIQSAVEKAREYIEAGYTYAVEIDVENFFDEVDLKKLLDIL